MAKGDIVLQMKGITKTFPNIIANDNITFDVREGEIHALLGENGAGKSTLMNVLSGLYKPDKGEIIINGKSVSFTSPKDAINMGIGMIYQHFKLIDAFSVTENILVGDDEQPLFFNKRKAEKLVNECSKEFNFEIKPSAKIWQLSVGEQQTVEILKVLYRKANILILDEPTAVLTPIETAKLFSNLKKMAAKGCCIIIITHKLAEVCEIANRVTVLRRGKSVATVEEDEINYRHLSELMLNVSDGTTKEEIHQGNEVLLKVDNLCASALNSIHDISFELHSGEIIGVAGVSGNGQKELTSALAGIIKPNSGLITMQGKDITNKNARGKFESGIGFVPEDRLGMGLVANMNFAENLILRDYYTEKSSKLGMIKYKGLDNRVNDAIAKFDIAAPNPKAPVRLMSGGNLQKVLLAREIDSDPKVLIVAYPIRGLDVASSNFVFEQLGKIRDNGGGVFMVAEDLDSIFEHCDRIMVLYRGKSMGLFRKDEVTLSDVGMMMMGTPIEEVRKYETLVHF